MLEAFQKDLELMSKSGIYYCINCKKLRYFEFGKCGICEEDFREYVRYDGVTKRGLWILNCGVQERVNNSWTNIYWDDYSEEKKEYLKDDVGFNPELTICRGLKESRTFRPCGWVKDCFQYHCVDYEKYRVREKRENEFAVSFT